ncbi:unnamed protein product, partial [Brachionus calyciflorus]
MKILICILLAISSLVKCDYNLNIKMEYFKNEATHVGKSDKIKFKFCLMGSSDNQCDSKLETQILGENVISEEQFKQTTEFLNFKILNSQISTRDYFLNLSILVLNS